MGGIKRNVVKNGKEIRRKGGGGENPSSVRASCKFSPLLLLLSLFFFFFSLFIREKVRNHSYGKSFLPVCVMSHDMRNGFFGQRAVIALSLWSIIGGSHSDLYRRSTPTSMRKGLKNIFPLHQFVDRYIDIGHTIKNSEKHKSHH